MQHAPPSLRSIDPAWIDTLVTKCLQPASVLALLHDRGGADRSRVAGFRFAGRGVQMPALVAQHARMSAPRPFAAKRWIVGACVGLAFAAAGWALRDWWPTRRACCSPADLPISLAICDSTMPRLFRHWTRWALPSAKWPISRLGGLPPSDSFVERLYQMLEGLEIEWNAALGAPELAILGEAASARHVLSGPLPRLERHSFGRDASGLRRRTERAIVRDGTEDVGPPTAITARREHRPASRARIGHCVGRPAIHLAWSPPSQSAHGIGSMTQGDF